MSMISFLLAAVFVLLALGILFAPIVKTVIWGGRRLHQR